MCLGSGKSVPPLLDLSQYLWKHFTPWDFECHFAATINMVFQNHEHVDTFNKQQMCTGANPAGERFQRLGPSTWRRRCRHRSSAEPPGRTTLHYISETHSKCSHTSKLQFNWDPELKTALKQSKFLMQCKVLMRYTKTCPTQHWLTSILLHILHHQLLQSDLI